MSIRNYIEDNYGTSTSSETAHARQFDRMQAAMKRYNLDPFRDVSSIAKNSNYMSVITEAAKIPETQLSVTQNAYVADDIRNLNTLQENVASSILNEAVQGTDSLSPIILNSFGIQERALISAHLPRAVKQVTAKVDNFKLTERRPYIVDYAGNRTLFIDAFLPDSPLINNLKEVVELEAEPGQGSIDLDLYAELSVNKERKFGYDSYISGFEIEDPTDSDVTVAVDKISYDKGSVRQPDVETGAFAVTIFYTDLSNATHKATVSGQLDFYDGKLRYLTTTDPHIKKVKFSMVLSPETHHSALSVSYDIKHTPVHIPIGEHFEYSLSEEFKDASEKYYNVDAMALLTDYMGRAVEQVKDLRTWKKFEELGKSAIFKGKFDCEPPSGFAQGKEEHIKREFHPYIEKVCIILKNKVRISNCHFRVVGNPLDIRLPGAAGVEYIYKRNEQFAGDITLDYEFCVTSDVHKIFYLSSERIPQGKLYIFLIPNQIENNISTVNHYEYATYVSNKYKGTKSNLPTTMISTRYLTQEYFPVVATVAIEGNEPDEEI